MKIIDSLRGAWNAIKTTVNRIHITSAASLVDEVVNLATKATIAAPEIEALCTFIPAPLNVEILAIVNAAMPVLKLLSNEPKLKQMYDDARTSLAAEVTNILSGKVHDMATIKADLKSIFDNTIAAA